MKIDDNVKFYTYDNTKFETDEIDVEFETTKNLVVAEDARYCSERDCTGKPTRYGVFRLEQISIVICLCNSHAIIGLH